MKQYIPLYEQYKLKFINKIINENNSVKDYNIIDILYEKSPYELYNQITDKDYIRYNEYKKFKPYIQKYIIDKIYKPLKEKIDNKEFYYNKIPKLLKPKTIEQYNPIDSYILPYIKAEDLKDIDDLELISINNSYKNLKYLSIKLDLSAHNLIQDAIIRQSEADYIANKDEIDKKNKEHYLYDKNILIYPNKTFKERAKLFKDNYHFYVETEESPIFHTGYQHVDMNNFTEMRYYFTNYELLNEVFPNFSKYFSNSIYSRHHFSMTVAFNKEEVKKILFKYDENNKSFNAFLNELKKFDNATNKYEKENMKDLDDDNKTENNKKSKI